MNYILFDEFATRKNMLPLTFLRPIAEIRFGILTMREKWEAFLGCKTSTLTEKYLLEKFPLHEEELNILINASYQPDKKLLKHIKALKPNQTIAHNDVIVAMSLYKNDLDNEDKVEEDIIELDYNPVKLNYPWDIFSMNDIAIKFDYDLITKGRKSLPIPEGTHVIGANQIFIEKGAKVTFATINAEDGPVYIGEHAEIMEGANIRGPFAIGEHSVVKMGAKIYGATTIGKYSKVGGELNNTVFFGYSNKAHDGFIGHSVIAEWCNFGADTNVSNLKNTYEHIRIWNYAENSFIDTGQQFIGLIMGDHSKTSINTMINTGTSIGVNVNLFGTGFPRTFIPSFSWGGSAGFSNYQVDKALDVAERMMQRRNVNLTAAEKKILKSVYEISFAHRRNL